MENLSPEGKAIFDTIASANDKSHKKPKSDIETLIAATIERSVAPAVDRAVERAVETTIATAVRDMQAYTDAAEDALRSAMGLASLDDDSAPLTRPSRGAAETGPGGHRAATTTRGLGTGAAQPYVPPPARGITANPTQNSGPASAFGSLLQRERRATAHHHGKPPSMDFPEFLGDNPKFWQARSEDYFAMFDTDPDLWIAVAAMQFKGDAARWLSSVQHKFVRATWEEFCSAVVLRFGKNQHRTLVRKLYHLRQTGSVVEYVSAFSALMDQLTAYEPDPDMLHYTTRFIDGLKPDVRLIVAVQQPPDLDTAYTIALLQEEVGEGESELNSPTYRRPSSSQSSRQSRTSTPQAEPARAAPEQDKLSALKAYHRAKGLRFVCGEKWGKDHKCNTTVQLHVVQEMLDFCASGPLSSDSDDSDSDLMVLSAETQSSSKVARAIRLNCQVAGRKVVFLLDSGSSHSFLSSSLAGQWPQAVPLLNEQKVRIAGGGHLLCTHMIPQCLWTADGHEFKSDFKILLLNFYDGIIGMDWLSAIGTMQVNWQQKWLSFHRQGHLVFLQGEPPAEFECTVVELQLVQPHTESELPEEIRQILDKFAVVFDTPSGLPPRRACDHKIPLMEGAQPVRIRRYRHCPKLKTEIEKQIQGMLASGEISFSDSAFTSPIIMVKKRDGTWQLCLDYRNLNMLTLKSKYPLPVIDELLNELTGASWFSKLDLRAGYHQLRLAPGEEHKTAFHTHNGHYQFNVMAFGLTGAPATFQAIMNETLAPVLRKYAIVFFDDILVYSRTYEDHLQHLAHVLQLHQDNQWKVKGSKCAFAQRSISYLGFVVSEQGVATDPAKIVDILKWPMPTNLKELRGILGVSGYYRNLSVDMG